MRKKQGKKGFDYFLEEEKLKDYKEKPTEKKLQWLYAANKLRKYYPKEVIESHE
ncbi:MAG: hypothetical protein PF545_01740 [Elusimicrobia bacterium]|jgi:hypothetical protein|nr:hypothetical protein [Elusimicrobiota bacterium]